MSDGGQLCFVAAARGARPFLALLALWGALFLPSGEAQAAEQTNLPPSSPPEFMANKSPLPKMLLKDKRTNTYFTGFPVIGWDADVGFNYGGAVQWFNNGPKESPFFDYTPYRERAAVTAAGSTRGQKRALIGYDRPYVGDSAWRIRAAGAYDQNPIENYFGFGESTLGPLTYPGSPLTYDDFEEYSDALERKVNGQTWERYNRYRKTHTGGLVTLERDFWGGWLRPQLGMQFSYVDVRDYTGDTIDGAEMQPTRLFTDHQAGRIIGFDGGWDNALKFGLTFDTRDFEPDPASGVMAQVAARISSKIVGSAFNYEQFTVSGRAFHNLLGDRGRLILAGRLTYVMQFGDVPFYSASVIPFTDGDVTGLGGHPTLRGFSTDRFVGDAAAYANGELRWSFADTVLWNQHLRFMLVPFVDTGRVFDSLDETTFKDWKVDGGAGLRIAWNLSTVVSFDYARSGEGHLFYMELGHQF